MAIFVCGASLLLWVLFKGREVIKDRVIGQEVKKERGDCRKHPKRKQTVFRKRHKPFELGVLPRTSQL